MFPNRKLWLFIAVSMTSLTKLQAQSRPLIPATQAIQIVSTDWRKDSSSCLGLRIKIYETVLNSKPDSLSKNKLFRELGNPNKIQRFYSGVTRRNYVEYIYYVYKDQCPKIFLEGYAVGFVFDETETTLVEIVDHEYCG